MFTMNCRSVFSFIFLSRFTMIGFLFMACLSLADTHYVMPINPGAAWDYTSWSTAATNIQDAVKAAGDGDIVLVTNGTYYSSGSVTNVTWAATNSMVVIIKGITVRSVNGFTNTIVNGNSPTFMNRCFYVSHSKPYWTGLPSLKALWDKIRLLPQAFIPMALECISAPVWCRIA